jgi:hypothetical protein
MMFCIFSLLLSYTIFAKEMVGVIGVQIIPNPGSAIIVRLPPSAGNQLITMSQVSENNDDEVPVVGDRRS